MYPIKSCGGVEVATMQLDGYGLVHDRRWLIVDPAGKFITQREIPAMAHIQPTLLGSDGAMALAFPGSAPLRLPPPRDYAETQATELVLVRALVSIHGERVHACMHACMYVSLSGSRVPRGSL